MNMNKKFLIVLAFPIAILACKKTTDVYTCVPSNPTTIASDSEIANLQTYINNKGLAGVVTRHPSGFFYKIDAAGAYTYYLFKYTGNLQGKICE
jgi:hypothetical protein